MMVLNRARTLATTIVLLIALVAAGLAVAAPAHAADITGPVLSSPSVTSTNLNLHNGPARINITLRLTDKTGVDTPIIIASWVNPDPMGFGGQSQGFGEMTLASGTVRDGIWKHSITIPQGAAPGKWDVKLYPLRDTWGNRSTFFTKLATITVLDEAPRTVGSTPTITGTVRVGSTLTGKPGTWSPAPVNLSYQWYRSGVAITGATVPTYKLLAADLGKTITVKVSGRKTGYMVTSKISLPTAVVATNLLTAIRPVITGTPAVGKTLTAKTGAWSPAGVTLTYQWNRNGAPIAGATAATYKVVSADAGSALTVRVTGRKSGYVAKGATSTPTSPVTR